MSTEQKVDVVVGELREAESLPQRSDHVLHGDVACSSGVEYLERIKEIEIVLECCLDSRALQFSLQENVVLQHLGKLCLLYPVVASDSSSHGCNVSWRLLLSEALMDLDICLVQWRVSSR